MANTKKTKRHFMDDSLESYRKIRKPMPKPSRLINDESKHIKFDWRDEIDLIDSEDDFSEE